MTKSSSSPEPPCVEIYTDGGCEPNPGVGAYAAVLLHPKKRLEISGGFLKTTNNRMEILAAIAGLEKLQQRCKVTVYSDSQYLVNAIEEGWAKRWKANGWWKSKTEQAKNIDLWDRLLALCETHMVKFEWLKGHAGNKENERCDELAMLARRQADLPIDAGYENRPETEGVRPDPREGDPCRKCSASLIKRPGRFKPTREYYYEFHLFCPKCGTTYHIESAKRAIEQPPSLF